MLFVKRILIACLCVLIISSYVNAAEPALFSPVTNFSNTTYSLHSSVLYRFWGFRVYHAALYTHNPGVNKSNSSGTEDLWSKHLLLKLHYYRDLKKEDFFRSAKKILSKNPGWREEKHLPLLKAFSDTIVDVHEGDEYALAYNPMNKSLTLIYNQTKVLAVSEDEFFSKAYLGMWIGEYPVRESKRDILVKGYSY